MRTIQEELKKKGKQNRNKIRKIEKVQTSKEKIKISLIKYSETKEKDWGKKGDKIAEKFEKVRLR